jgi:ribulose-bisphosphate carboxylase large chain
MSRSDHFWVRYRIVAESESAARNVARRICVEQSVEMPPGAVPDQAQKFVAIPGEVNSEAAGIWRVDIQFLKDLVSGDPVQFLNVIYGNISLLPGIRVADIDAVFLEELFAGPAFGTEGIRNKLNVYSRPLSCTALKPIGLSAGELAHLALKFSSGGLDVIKDDHGLADQKTAPFSERVSACVRAIRKGEQVSGKRTLYFPNITSNGPETLRRYHQAADLGADGVVVCPQLCGWGMLSKLAAENRLPMMAHPAFSGSLVAQNSHGIDPSLLYGTLWRAMGADIAVYPNTGGRFSLTSEQCLAINRKCREAVGFKPSLPAPGGGISRDTLSQWVERYERDTLFLIGGSLYEHPAGIETAAREFQQALENYG